MERGNKIRNSSISKLQGEEAKKQVTKLREDDQERFNSE